MAGLRLPHFLNYNVKMTNGLCDVILFLLVTYFQYAKGFLVSPKEKIYRTNRIENELRLSAQFEPLPIPHQKNPTSYISEIRSSNLAGIYADEAYSDVVIDLRAENSVNLMVAVSGETGSGKSLLVSKVADLVTGGKLDPTLLQRPSNGQSKELIVSTEMGEYSVNRFGLERDFSNAVLLSSSITIVWLPYFVGHQHFKGSRCRL